MATAWEQRQQIEAARQQQRRRIGSAAGAAVQIGKEATLQTAIQTGGGTAALAANVQSGSIAAAVIDVVGNLGIAAWQYLSGKKAQKKKIRLQRKQQAVQDNAIAILQTIIETGSALVMEHGIDPTTPEFEQILVDNLYDSVGYRGNCNARVWVPGSKPGEPNRPIWFIVSNNGRSIRPVTLRDAPPNFAAFWFTECRNAKDAWANTYMQMLIQQGRAQELADFQAAYKSGDKYMKIGFGIIGAILTFIIIRNMLRIK